MFQKPKSFQAPRQTDFYEISPRPFTIQPSSNNGFYARPPPRPSSGYQQNRNVYQETSQQQQQPPQQLIDPFPDNVRQQVNDFVLDKCFELFFLS